MMELKVEKVEVTGTKVSVGTISQKKVGRYIFLLRQRLALK